MGTLRPLPPQKQISQWATGAAPMGRGPSVYSQGLGFTRSLDRGQHTSEALLLPPVTWVNSLNLMLLGGVRNSCSICPQGERQSARSSSALIEE